MEEEYNKIALYPSVLLSYLIEKGTYSKPIYIQTPKKIIKMLEANTVLLYPYEWTEEEATDWLKRDANDFKSEDSVLPVFILLLSQIINVVKIFSKSTLKNKLFFLSNQNLAVYLSK